MLKKTCFGAVLLAAAAVSTTAMAQDRGVNTAVGALAGAAIGGSVGGRNGAIVGGVIGAAVGNSARTRDDYYYRNRGYYQPRGYYQSSQVYVEPRSPTSNRPRCTSNRARSTTIATVVLLPRPSGSGRTTIAAAATTTTAAATTSAAAGTITAVDRGLRRLA